MSDKIINIEYEPAITCVNGKPVKFTIWAFILCGIISMLLLTMKPHIDYDLPKDRCKMQLDSTNNLIEVIMEYKNRSQAMLAVTKKYQKTDESRFKEVMETCYARTHESTTCEAQLDALQYLCKASEMDCMALAREQEPTGTGNNISNLAH